MGEKILVVEDQFIEANDLRIILERAGHRVCGIARSVQQAITLVIENQPDIVLVDIFLKGKLTGIDLAKTLSQKNIPFMFLSANSNESTLEAAKATQPHGFLVKPFRERDILIALEIASYRHRQMQDIKLKQEKWLSSQLSGISGKSVSQDEKALLLAKAFQPFVHFDLIFMVTNIATKSVTGFQRVEYDEYAILELRDFAEDPKSSGNEKYFADMVSPEKTIVFNNGNDFIASCLENGLNEKLRANFGMLSSLIAPVSSNEISLGAIMFYSSQEDCFNDGQVDLLTSLSPLLSNVIENLNSLGSDGDLRFKSVEIGRINATFPEIVGRSSKLLNVLDQVSQVSPYDTSVLILGETGVGKEGLVDAIHRLSPRRNKPLIKINCAAIPSNLVESELFGHEKGAFTGAVDRRIGKFEQAQGGTVFLDEIGEIPLDIQSKLLRVLQEKEIERLGGRTVIKIDVRIIAATNRNLYKEVANGDFRMDLFYRLNVFPISLPPLRERSEDISLLVSFFLKRHAEMFDGEIKKVSTLGMRKLQEYSWPGNVRELQHLIERSVLTAGPKGVITIDLPEEQAENTVEARDETVLQSIEDVEKAHIMAVLKRCNGKISGNGGAAEILKIPASSLSAKMKKLGIGWQHTYM